MKRRKRTGVYLAVCVMTVIMAACSKQESGRADESSLLSDGKFMAGDSGDRAERKEEAVGESQAEEDSGHEMNAASRDQSKMDGVDTGAVISSETTPNGDEGAGREKSDGEESAPSPSGDIKNSAEGVPDRDEKILSALHKDAYLSGPQVCPDVTFVPDGEVTADGGTFLLSSSGEETDWCYDEFETLNRYMHGEWHRVPVITGRCGNTSYMAVPSAEPETFEIEWQWLYGQLPPGIYCLEKEVFPRDVLDREYKSLEEREEAMEAFGKHVCATFILHDEPDIQMEIWDVTPAGLKLQFTHLTGRREEETEYSFGSWYELEQYTEGEWKPVPTVEGIGAYAWKDLAYWIPDEGSEVLEIDWEWLYGSLEEGSYRIHKSVYSDRDATAEVPMYTAFVVANGREEE